MANTDTSTNARLRSDTSTNGVAAAKKPDAPWVKAKKLYGQYVERATYQL